MSRIVITLTMTLVIVLKSYGQSIEGIWKNIQNDEVQSHIEVFESDGKIHAKVVELFPTSLITLCHKCKGEDKGARLTDVLLVNNMKSNDHKWTDGKILDPKSGKKYACQIELVDDNTLKIRGYVGNPLFGKTFYWHRVL